MSILNLEGAYENELAATGEFHAQAPRTALTLPSGQRIVLPTELLLQGLHEAAPPTAEVPANHNAPHPVANDEAVIPLVEEQLLVGKRQVETARVRVRRETEEHVQRVSVPLEDVRWEIEHVPVEQLVDARPDIRQVGETMIFPLVEERMVVKRELWLREEVHVRKLRTVVEKSADFPVKRDVLIEERSDTHPEEVTAS